MTHVLIVVGWFGGYVGGAIVTTQEFSSQAACENAKQVILAERQAWKIGDLLRPICVPK